ncbi:MAG: hypothetical protein KGD67_10275 [Candidatus Lokiarchaeota archaeon]|nr:hypothetical protein [Candidatus Lokiarchaeota archaeon]
MELDDFAEAYILLGLRINKHIDGYVEHYYGPPKLKKIVDSEELSSPNKLLNNWKNLKIKLQNQDFEKKRYRFLDSTLTAIKTILRKLNGESIPYFEQIKNLFNLEPVLYDDNFFYGLTKKAEELYKGKGTLSERIKRIATQRTIPSDRLLDLYMKAIQLARTRTKEVFPKLLPDNEKIELAEVFNQSWLMYCWYKGNYTSKIEVNLSSHHYWTHLLYFACHEAYPGHHTERAVRERLLYRKKGYFESSILLIYSPEMVISEGIGVTAESVMFSPTESIRSLIEDIHPVPINEVSIETLIDQSEIRRGFRRFESNVAYHKYVNKWDDKKLIDYAKSFKVIPDTSIKAQIKFISDKLWAPYAMAYQGERLITEKYGVRPSPKDFRRLLIEQTLPSDLT